jgi:hypothetical protein
VKRALATAAIAFAIAVPRLAAATDLQPRVLVLPSEGKAPTAMPKLPAEIADALARGAAKTTGHVARADASFSDTAVIVGCDPSTNACLDAVAAALNVDQVVFAKITAKDKDAQVEVIAVTRDSEPQAHTFLIRAASHDADLASLEPAVVEMLESGEARRSKEHHDTTQPQQLPPPPPKIVEVEEARPSWPVVVTVGGAALVITGASFWALASSKQSDIDHAPTSTAADLDKLADLESTAKHDATIGNVMFVGGAVIAVTGAALWWRSWRGDHGVAIAPSVGPDHAAVMIGGVW